MGLQVPGLQVLRGALVVAEAVACRLPVIASNIPAHRAQLGDAYPALFTPGDVEGLAEYLRHFVGDDAFAQGLRRQQAALAIRSTM